ncbi:hypothetical protein WH87_03745 [Devosia epidermidihirudinis]|uniref:DUF1275 domain-containing protein n=1 Tax=Devosia epidermidihirudinis TaxID=1293439 RepID=A0A0F5QF16_9HYPH|nr:YoaK family protein [Devosia epidermidihirudinis]KKC39341.1 hypothetical protein WH87_03745 [Devosia epidermidihirudinis]
MKTTPQLSHGLLLTAAAGFTDVIGFIELSGHYISFMSGNTTQLGDAIGTGDWSGILLPALLLLLFFVGSAIGAYVAIFTGPSWAACATTGVVLVSLIATLILAYLGAAPDQFMLVLAAGAGAQNAILPAAGSVRLGITFVTGTLFAAGQDFARATLGQAPRWRWAQHLLVWASLLFGALLGTLAYGALGIGSLLVTAALYAVFVVAFLRGKPEDVIN